MVGFQRNDFDSVFASAVEATAAGVDATAPTSFLESKIVRVVENRLVDAFGLERVGHERAFPIPDWTPGLGHVDLFVLCEFCGGLSCAAEMKVDDIGWVLWDLFKVSAAMTLPGMNAAYLVAAASGKRWESGTDCTGLFPAAPTPPVRRETLRMVDEWRGAWADLLNGGTARPTRVPRVIETRFIASHPVPAYPGYELRAIGVTPVVDAGWLKFDGGWPEGLSAV